jgi:hypothetical protein
MKTITNANVLQISEFKVKQSQQKLFLPGTWVWSRFYQGAN